MTAYPDDSEGSEAIGRCYTKARRAPLVHGVIRDVNGGRGIRLPGGPYTLTQLAGIVSTVVVLVLTRPLWGGHGALDAAVVIILPFAVAFGLRHLHVDGRNPAAALVSVAVMLGSPRWGTFRGRPYRSVGPLQAEALVHLVPTPAARPLPDTAVPAEPEEVRRPRTRQPAAALPFAGSGAPVASGAQALLARRAATRSRLEN
ncbi:hypothetical protein [Streptomyces sp. NPDC001502]|uniref:hypothetical protein n=1 Tax=Streptomyces sp. NPDC001502 TaxID=3364578 RepID=UPI0036CA389A